MIKPYIIGVSGESGVGKSTIAEIISLFFGVNNTTVISTDDLHKWERTNSNWNKTTHLNPDANNLELGDIHMDDLSQGKFIYRSVYNHVTGNFNPPLKIIPKEVVIVEGLHSFYTNKSKQIVNLKIFIDTNEELRTHWKILRDTEDRGYKYNVVLETINKRKFDNDQIRNTQIHDADVIITITPLNKILCLGDKREKIDLSISISYTNKIIHEELFLFMNYYIVEFNRFVKLSELIGNDLEMCQDAGGNLSVKVSDDYMIIKSSGFKLKDVFKNHSIIDYKLLLNSLNKEKINNDDLLNSFLMDSVISSKYKKPSMETCFHTLLKKYTIHVHPIYLTLLLCLKDSKDIIKQLFSEFDYQYIEYATPGYNLYKSIKTNIKDICFLENHGLILSFDNIEGCVYNKLCYLNNKSKEYIKENCDFEEFDSSFSNKNIIEKFNIFPDSVIFNDDSSKKEILAAHNYIIYMGNKLGNIRQISNNNVSFLKKLESEKYRKTV